MRAIRDKALLGGFLALLACAAITAAPILQSERLRNAKVVAVEYTLRPGETAPLDAGQASVTVYFDGGSLAVSPQGQKPRNVAVTRGDTVFSPAQAGLVKNAGSAEMRFVRVDFLGAGGTQTWGTSGLAPDYKLLFENSYARVYDIRIPAGGREPQHSHQERVVVCLSGAKLVHLMPDGREEPSTLKTGEVRWRGGATHIGQNLGTTDLWVIAIEPK
jgi:hypothetical protein